MFALNLHFRQLRVELFPLFSQVGIVALFESRNHNWWRSKCRIAKQIILVAEILFLWPYQIVMYTARPSHLNPSNLCRIITNKQTFNCIVTLSLEIIFHVQSGCKGQRKQSTINQANTIDKTMWLFNPGADHFPNLFTRHLRTLFCSFRMTLHAHITHSFTAPLEIPIALPIFWKDASLSYSPKYLSNNMMCNIEGHLFHFPQQLLKTLSFSTNSFNWCMHALSIQKFDKNS